MNSQHPSPIAAADFARRMAAVGPFEAGVHIAAAVSGGADSLCLARLADRWARARGGRLTALTVDHGLRPEAASEARDVGRLLGELGIPHAVLRWTGDKPRTGIQAAARDARYRLLGDWCRDNGVLHLLLGHHLQDQAETFLLRLGRGSGVAGLAAMPAIAERGPMRLLRPLLGYPKERLRGHLAALGQPWIEDPSNADPAFARVRLRRSLAGFAGATASAEAVARSAARMGSARIALEEGAAALLAGALTLHPAGFAAVDASALVAAPQEISLFALARILSAVGGRVHGPGRAALQRLRDELTGAGRCPAPSWKGATLGRCRIMPQAGAPGRLLVCRERRALPEPMIVAEGAAAIVWDRRFAIRISGGEGGRPAGLRLEPLGRDGQGESFAEIVRKGLASAALGAVPAAARVTLPALKWGGEEASAVPLGYGAQGPAGLARMSVSAAFCPPAALSATGFVVAE